MISEKFTPRPPSLRKQVPDESRPFEHASTEMPASEDDRLSVTYGGVRGEGRAFSLALSSILVCTACEQFFHVVQRHDGLGAFGVVDVTNVLQLFGILGNFEAISLQTGAHACEKSAWMATAPLITGTAVLLSGMVLLDTAAFFKAAITVAAKSELEVVGCE